MIIRSLLFKPIFAWLNQQKPLPTYPLSNFDRICQEAKPCDVLLIEGRSRVSEVIKQITQSSWSHAALYIGPLDSMQSETLKALVQEHYQGDANKPLIIESELGIGTVIRSIEHYEKEHIRICRPSGLKTEDAVDVIRYAISCIGYSYNVRQIFDLARFLFPWHILPRRWRSSLFETNIGKQTKTVCSTMIAEAFNFVQFPILPLIQEDENNQLSLYRRNPRLCVPKDFDYSPYFQIIKYPFIDYNKHQSYRHLPWRGEFNSALFDLDTTIEQFEDDA